MHDYPSVPKQELMTSNDGNITQVYRIPRGIRPVLAKFHLELLTWGESKAHLWRYNRNFRRARAET